MRIEQYLSSKNGAAVGLDVVPDRFCDPEVRNQLDCQSSIKGLWLTSQDTVLCGVTLAQLAGVVCAFRIEGFSASLRILLSSVFQGWGWI